ncbi:MAG: McrB family protein [Actinomycetota bacterium]
MVDDSGKVMGLSRAVRPSVQPMYEAAERWRDESLVGDRSLFSGAEIDGVRAARELIEGFVDQPDLGAGTFISKLRSQLSEAGPEAVQTAAELLFVHFLIMSTAAMKGEKKREQVNQVVAFRDQGTSRIPSDLESALFAGVANPGTAYNTYRWKMFGYLIRIVVRFKDLSPDVRSAAVENLDAFRKVTADIDVQSAWSQQFALEHLLFPDEAPAIVSRDDRSRIVAAFAPESQQLQIEELVSGLEPNVEYGGRQAVNFYRTPYRHRWQGVNGKLQTYIEWARLVLNREDFTSEEMDWKYARAQEISAASRAILDGKELHPHVKRIFRTADLVDFRVASDFTDWALKNPRRFREGLSALHASPGPAGIDAFLHQIPSNEFASIGARLSVASLLLFAIDPENMPPWRAEPAKVTIRLTNGNTAQQSATAGEHYLEFLERLDTVIDVLREVDGLSISRLEAQGAAWLMAKSDMHGLPEAQRRAFIEWRDGKGTAGPQELAATSAPTLEPDLRVAPSANAAMSVEDLARKLHFDDDGVNWLQEAVELLKRKGQVILQGPPGTGKTYIARRLAEFVSGADDVVLTQFHPGTTYEDFIQGLRPDPANPSAFTLVDGPFLKAARVAEDHPEKTVVVVIDEINRGNIPAIFGELYFLLEYRDQTMTLNYGGLFRLPRNLLVIGTMNTADRSITALDAALRRRFFVLDLRPGEVPVDGMLRTYLRAEEGEPWLADLLDTANSLISDRDQHIGPSHLMVPEEVDARRSWTYSVLPTLQELYYNSPDRWQDFDFDSLKGKVRGIASDAAAD